MDFRHAKTSETIRRFFNPSGHEINRRDYENKNYRIIIASEDGKLLNLDKKGNEVKGWGFKANNSNITDKLQHFVVGGKDYILYPAKDKNLALLARNGKIRVSYNPPSEFNSQALQVDKKGTLYGVTFEGKLWRGTLDGNTTELPLPNLITNSKFLIDKKYTDLASLINS